MQAHALLVPEQTGRRATGASVTARTGSIDRSIAVIRNIINLVPLVGVRVSGVTTGYRRDSPSLVFGARVDPPGVSSPPASHPVTCEGPPPVFRRHQRTPIPSVHSTAVEPTRPRFSVIRCHRTPGSSREPPWPTRPRIAFAGVERRHLDDFSGANRRTTRGDESPSTGAGTPTTEETDAVQEAGRRDRSGGRRRTPRRDG